MNKQQEHVSNLIELLGRLNQLSHRIEARTDLEEDDKIKALVEIKRSTESVNYCILLIKQKPIYTQ